MKVCFIATRFFTGGFTTSMVNMIRVLVRNDVHVDILLLNPESNEIKPTLPDSVHLLNPSGEHIGLVRKMITPSYAGNFLSYVKAYAVSLLTRTEQSRKELIRQFERFSLMGIQNKYQEVDLSSYDCVVSWEELSCNMFLAEKVKARRKIGFIHPDYEAAGFSREVDLPIFRKLDRLNAISEANARVLKRVFPEIADRISYVPNVIDFERVRRMAEEKEEKLFAKSAFDMVTVCRLDNMSKALDRAVRITDRLNRDGLQFNWYVVGEGYGRKEIEQLLRKLKVSNLILLGSSGNPYPYMKRADLFVLQSKYEGKPLTVDEAMICGTPVLVTDYASAGEQVQDGVTGFIVANDEEKIYLKLKELIAHPEKLLPVRQHLSEQGGDQYENIDSFLKMIRPEA